MTNSPKLGIGLLDVGQSQKEVTVNEALLRMETLLAGVLTQAQNTAPVSPNNGDAHIVGTAPTGAWAGKALNVAFYIAGSGWRFIAPVNGMATWLISNNTRLVFYSNAWSALNELPALTVGTNLLINGHFAFWQRGTTLTPNDNAYAADRWRFLAESNGAATLTQETTTLPAGFGSGCRLTVAIANQKFGVLQWIEGQNGSRALNQQVTLSVRLAAAGSTLTTARIAIVQFTGTRDNVSVDPISAWNAAGTAPTLSANHSYVAQSADITLTSTYQTVSVTGTVGSSMSNLGVLIWTEDKTTTITTDILRISGVQLEVGSIATPFENRLLSAEELLCQRYCQIIGNGFVGVAASTTSFEGMEKFRVRMRAAPSASVIAGIACSMRASGDASAATPGLNAPTTSQNSIWTQITGFSGLTTGTAMQSRNISSSEFILLTAEL